MCNLRNVKRWRRQRYALIITLISLASTSCGRLVHKPSTPPSPVVPVYATLAVSSDIPLEIEAVGSVEAIESVDVKSRIAGQVSRVAFKEGQMVKQGQPLFTIDPEALRRLEDELRAELERDLATEQQTRAVVARDKATLKQSQSEADVALQLGKLGVLARQRVDQLATVGATSRALFESDEAAANAAASATRADRARLSQTQLQKSYATIIAPISGRTGSILVRPGNMVRESDQTMVSLVKLAPIYVTFSVPEQVLAEVRRSNAASPLLVTAISVDGSTFNGNLTFVDNTVAAGTGAVVLKATFANTDLALWPGQFVDIRLRLRTEKDKVVVPSSAIQDGIDGKYVWVIRSGVATILQVKLARSHRPERGPEIAVLDSGVVAGDLIVTEGQLRLTPGAKVTVMDTSANHNVPSPGNAKAASSGSF